MLRTTNSCIRSLAPGVSKSLGANSLSTQIRTFTTSSTLKDAENVAPDLNNLEKRWPKMKDLDQADVIEYLSDRAELDWKELTTPEKRALYYIYFGNWGPRSEKQQKNTSQIVMGSLGGGILFVALGIAVYNYALDVEREEKLAVLGTRLEEELKKRQEEIKGISAKSWWKLW